MACEKITQHHFAILACSKTTESDCSSIFDNEQWLYKRTHSEEGTLDSTLRLSQVNGCETALIIQHPGLHRLHPAVLVGPFHSRCAGNHANVFLFQRHVFFEKEEVCCDQRHEETKVPPPKTEPLLYKTIIVGESGESVLSWLEINHTFFVKLWGKHLSRMFSTKDISAKWHPRQLVRTNFPSFFPIVFFSGITFFTKTVTTSSGDYCLQWWLFILPVEQSY